MSDRIEISPYPPLAPLEARAQSWMRRVFEEIAYRINNHMSTKARHTAIGGFAVQLTNKTGVDSVKGEVVIASTTTDFAVSLAPTSSDDLFGVFLDSGIPDGSEAWIVVSGRAEVKADATGFTRGARVIMSAATAGRVKIGDTPSTAEHWTEHGHAIQTAAANATGQCVIHFN